MTIGNGSQIEIVVESQPHAMVNLNVWQYDVIFYPLSITPVQLLEAYWNHVKAAYRGIYPIAYGALFRSLRVRELNNPVGDYAEFDIPLAERTGTRPNPVESQLMPPFTSAGVRLVVGSRATRPGQKRFSCLAEGDNVNGVLSGTAVTSVQALAALMVTPMVLGAPAALADLLPIVTRKDTAGNVTASQPITGFIVNQFITSQNTRKFGRGS